MWALLLAGAAALRLQEVSTNTTLDVGLDAFVQNLTSALVEHTKAKVNATGNLSHFETMVGEVLRTTLKTELKPVKQEIGQHWVDLKEEKRDEYVTMLKKKFTELLSKGYDGYLRHADLKFHTGKDLTSDHLAADLDYIVKSPTKRLVGTLKDYTDLLYMSNIFLSFHVTHQRSHLILATIKIA